MVRNCEMACYADLAAEHAILSYLRRACNPCLGCHHGMLAYLHIMCDLAEVVYLDSLMDDGGFGLGPVYCGVGTYLHIILYDDIAGMLYLLVSTVISALRDR